MPGEGLTHGPPATKKAGGSYHRFSQIIRHSPRGGFNGVLRALPGDRAFLPPSPNGSIRRLDTSVGVSGPHDFAVRQSAVRPHENSRAPLSRPSHPVPRFVTTRDPPLLPGQDARMISTDLRKTEVEYFSRRGWTGIRKPCPTRKSVAPTHCDFDAFIRGDRGGVRGRVHDLLLFCSKRQQGIFLAAVARHLDQGLAKDAGHVGEYGDDP